MQTRLLDRPSEKRPAKRQTAQVKHLALELRKTYRRLRSWPMTARHHGITKPDGSPNPGLAFRIARQGYEPRTDECRQRIGLRSLAPAPRRMWDESLASDPEVVAIVEWAEKITA